MTSALNRWIGTGMSIALVVGCGSGKNGMHPPGDSGPLIDVGPPPMEDPVEPVWLPDAVGARVKSPGQRMRYTAGLPFRILADAQDPLAYQCPPGHPPYVCPDSSVQFFIDGVMVGTAPPDPNNMNLWELRLPNGLTLGDHVITVKFTPHSHATIDGIVPIYIHADPMPTHANMVSLSSDLTLTGNMDLNWSDAVVIGNGHKVTAQSGYTGKVTIKNSMVTGLADFDNQVGISVTTTGAVDIEDSIFEATAPLKLAVNGSSPITINHNELRSSNYVTYVSSDPTKSPILDLGGNTSGAKTMKGNNIGAGIVLITNMRGWQIGGLHDSESNILVGPRCVFDLEGSQNATIQGNYIHHDYYGGFSQGYNLEFGASTDGALAEHNVIRDGSWPLQSFGGEFRYNLMINSGHDFMRGGVTAANFHHNILAHAQAASDSFDGAMFVYNAAQNMKFDSNTIDVGAGPAHYDAPAIVLGSPNTQMASLRNNVFSGFVDPNGGRWQAHAMVSANDTEASVSGPRITTADYNAWANPLVTSAANYMPGIVGSSPGGHDVTGGPMFNGNVPQVPYQIDEGFVWLRQYGVSQVLAYYRALYTPRDGSPLIDTGDPSLGAGADIGAIGNGAVDTNDKFGLVVDSN